MASPSPTPSLEIEDPETCRVLYTFVMGGGVSVATDGEAAMMTRKMPDANNNNNNNNNLWDAESVNRLGTRCLWEDPGPDCGGTDITRWTLEYPKCNVSELLARELSDHNDVTFLNIPENHNMGKTDTWFTYVAMLTREHPAIRKHDVRFVMKMDGDNFINFPGLFDYFDDKNRQAIEDNRYIYGGWSVMKHACSQRSWGRVCADPRFTAPLFATGALAYLSTPLAQHVFLNGTSLSRKKRTWIGLEDMQLANMAYSSSIDSDNSDNTTIMVYNLNFRHYTDKFGRSINTHCSNDPICYRNKYYEQFPPGPEEKPMHINSPSPSPRR